MGVAVLCFTGFSERAIGVASTVPRCAMLLREVLIADTGFGRIVGAGVKYEVVRAIGMASIVRGCLMLLREVLIVGAGVRVGSAAHVVIVRKTARRPQINLFMRCPYNRVPDSLMVLGTRIREVESGLPMELHVANDGVSIAMLG